MRSERRLEALWKAGGSVPVGSKRTPDQPLRRIDINGTTYRVLDLDSRGEGPIRPGTIPGLGGVPNVPRFNGVRKI